MVVMVEMVMELVMIIVHCNGCNSCIGLTTLLSWLSGSLRTITSINWFDDLIVHGCDRGGGTQPSQQQPVKVGPSLGNPETYVSTLHSVDCEI